MHKNLKIFLGIFVGTIFVVGYVWYATAPTVTTAPVIHATSTPRAVTITAPVETPAVAPPKTVPKAPIKPAAPSTPTQAPYHPREGSPTTLRMPDIAPPAVEQIPLTISIEGDEYVANVMPGSTGLEAMRSLLETSDLTFTGHEYPGLGMFIDAINGKKNEDGHYWILYVNGKCSELGISSLVVRPGDTIEWKYEKAGIKNNC